MNSNREKHQRNVTPNFLRFKSTLFNHVKELQAGKKWNRILIINRP